MTDGEQSLEKGDTRLTMDILYEAVQPLKERGIRVISLGIGSNAKLEDLLTLASSDTDVYFAKDFKELKTLVTDLTEKNCPGRLVVLTCIYVHKYVSVAL